MYLLQKNMTARLFAFLKVKIDVSDANLSDNNVGE